MNTPKPEQSRRTYLWRGLRKRCPHCGQGKLFGGYLQQQDHCTHCQEELASLRADDGPAWLTILVVGHILAPFIAHFALDESIPSWALVASFLGIMLAMVYVLLPSFKGLFIAGLWIIRSNKE